MAATETDCRSEEEITVGLIDALISIYRVLVKRDLSPAAVGAALKGLHGDVDFHRIHQCGGWLRPPGREEQGWQEEQEKAAQIRYLYRVMSGPR